MESAPGLVSRKPSAARPFFPALGVYPQDDSIAVFVSLAKHEGRFALLLLDLVLAGRTLVARAIEVDDIACLRALQLRVVCRQSTGANGGKLHVAIVFTSLFFD